MKSTADWPFSQIVVRATFSFVVLSPLMTFVLLLFKGLPPFAAGHTFDVVEWIYQTTWLVALMSGLWLSLVLTGIRSWLHFFIQPYDFGRCFSLGAVSGALAQAFSTWVYRALSHRPFSSFWIADAMIAGALAGSGITAFLLWRLSKETR